MSRYAALACDAARAVHSSVAVVASTQIDPTLQVKLLSRGKCDLIHLPRIQYFRSESCGDECLHCHDISSYSPTSSLQACFTIFHDSNVRSCRCRKLLCACEVGLLFQSLCSYNGYDEGVELCLSIQVQSFVAVPDLLDNLTQILSVSRHISIFQRCAK